MSCYKLLQSVRVSQILLALTGSRPDLRSAGVCSVSKIPKTVNSQPVFLKLDRNSNFLGNIIRWLSEAFFSIIADHESSSTRLCLKFVLFWLHIRCFVLKVNKISKKIAKIGLANFIEISLYWQVKTDFNDLPFFLDFKVETTGAFYTAGPLPIQGLTNIWKTQFLLFNIWKRFKLGEDK